MAESQMSIGRHNTEALKDFEKLFQLTGKVYYQYKIASIQFNLKRMMECGTTLNSILNNMGVVEREDHDRLPGWAFTRK